MAHQELIEELEAAILNVSNDPTGSQLLAEKAIVRAQRNGWIKAMAYASLLSGLACKKLRFYEEGIVNTQRAIGLLNDLQQETFVAQAMETLGHIYVALGEYSQAIEQFRKALSWIAEHNVDVERQANVRVDLCKTLMDLGQWSEAEQELLALDSESSLDQAPDIDYQLLVLRLGFYRGDQATIQKNLNLCRELIYQDGSEELRLSIDFYLARFTGRFEHVKRGEALLKELWLQLDHNDVNWLFLFYEAADDALRSDYPKKGEAWFNTLLELESSPKLLKNRIHLSLAHFFVCHKSFENAVIHYQASESLSKAMRESELNQQWLRYRAEQTQLTLKEQIAQHKQNNQVLAESNALLQAVNRIALDVNAALDLDALLKRLKQQLFGWIDVDIIGIAEVKETALYYGTLADEDRKLTYSTLDLSEEHSWSVRSINSGRIMFDNHLNRDSIEYKPIDVFDDVKSAAFTPLKCDNKIIGLLSLQGRKENIFDIKAVSLLEYISPVVGIAFANLLNLRRSQELSGALSKQQQELDDVRQLMAHLSDHDELTGLPNRSSLPSHFKKWKMVGSFNFFVFKIDNVKDVNSELGFGFDEKLVKVIGQRLFNRLRPDDQLIRMSDDEFLIITRAMNTKRDATDFASNILNLAQQPMRDMEVEFNARAHIGIVQYPEHGETIEELMSMAGLALMHAEDDEARIFCID